VILQFCRTILPCCTANTRDSSGRFSCNKIVPFFVSGDPSILRDEIALLHSHLLYERQRREVLGARNRRLLGNRHSWDTVLWVGFSSSNKIDIRTGKTRLYVYYTDKQVFKTTGAQWSADQGTGEDNTSSSLYLVYCCHDLVIKKEVYVSWRSRIFRSVISWRWCSGDLNAAYP
jgi:hypothetical protein